MTETFSFIVLKTTGHILAISSPAGRAERRRVLDVGRELDDLREAEHLLNALRVARALVALGHELGWNKLQMQYNKYIYKQTLFLFSQLTMVFKHYVMVQI